MLVSVFQRQTGGGTSQFCGGTLHRNAILVQIMKMEHMCQSYRKILEQVTWETCIVPLLLKMVLLLHHFLKDSV